MLSNSSELLSLTLTFLAGLFFMPSPREVVPGLYTTFPLNTAMWSMMFELGANFFYKLTYSYMKGIAVMGSAALIFFVVLALLVPHYHTTGLGWTFETMLGGIPRVLFSFLAGIAVYRIWLTSFFSFKFPAILFPMILIPMFGLSLRGVAAEVTELAILAAFPLIVLCAANSEPKNEGLKRTYHFLGRISYALYILHMPVATALTSPLKQFNDKMVPTFHSHLSLFMLSEKAILILAMLLFFHWIDVYYDQPIRSFLSRKWSSMKAPASG